MQLTKNEKNSCRRFMISGFFIVIVAVLLYGSILLISNLPISFESGWQKVEEINGFVPEGAIIVVAENSQLTMPNCQGFIKEGVVYFYQKEYCVIKEPVWIFIPSKGETLIKIEDFQSQCDSKLSDLLGELKEAKDSYFVGQP